MLPVTASSNKHIETWPPCSCHIPTKLPNTHTAGAMWPGYLAHPPSLDEESQAEQFFRGRALGPLCRKAISSPPPSASSAKKYATEVLHCCQSLLHAT